ncbi:MAG: hypothetical protein IJ300_13355 [Clostridia bacterium]|nr:hypothetical protein [Clostridia bacterium]
MLYKNNSSAAEAACERQRTGNYGADEYKYSSGDGQEIIYTEIFRTWREKDIMASFDLDSDPRLYEINNCKILKDLTPDRDLSEKIYLCKCNICGSTFTRCRKTLVFKHSDCGCVQNTGFRSGMYTDKLILELDNLSKKVLQAKINALGNPNLSETFQALYIDEKPYSEYTALEIGMSMATLYRSRKQIHKLLPKLSSGHSENK